MSGCDVQLQYTRFSAAMFLFNAIMSNLNFNVKHLYKILAEIQAFKPNLLLRVFILFCYHNAN